MVQNFQLQISKNGKIGTIKIVSTIENYKIKSASMQYTTPKIHYLVEKKNKQKTLTSQMMLLYTTKYENL